MGGESDSEEVVERSATSGFCSSSGGVGLKPWEADLIGQRRRAEEGLRREAERLSRSVDHLIADTDSLIHEGVVVVTAATESSGECESSSSATVVAAGEAKQDTAVLETVSARMKAFRAELQGFMEKVERLGDGQRERDRGDDLSPLPHLTESSSFLSTGTSLSRDSPIGTLGRDLLADLQVKPPYCFLPLLFCLLFILPVPSCPPKAPPSLFLMQLLPVFCVCPRSRLIK